MHQSPSFFGSWKQGLLIALLPGFGKPTVQKSHLSYFKQLWFKVFLTDRTKGFSSFYMSGSEAPFIRGILDWFVHVYVEGVNPLNSLNPQQPFAGGYGVVSEPMCSFMIFI